jgi:hypothetical protein
MRFRRLISVVAAAAAALGAAAALTAVAGAASPKPTRVDCSYEATTQIPDNQTETLPSTQQGQQWGSIYCSPIGWGVRKDAFTVLNNGDVKGTFTAFFRHGTIRGKFAMSQGEGSLGLSFQSTSYAGKVKVIGGSGPWKGVKGAGKTTCDSEDGIHFFCDDVLKLS